MSFFTYLLKSKGLSKHDGRPLWKYFLSNDEFKKLQDELKTNLHYRVDSRDVTLYYAIWWSKNYNGGTPSKEEVFKSLDLRSKSIYSQAFYKLAIKGAKMLGISWISKQNTLYFRTLLLQGGLPLMHLAENHGKYQNFLLAVLEEQPETIEDFMFNTQIVSLLPLSSQNEIIYESCFEIVRSILNDENIYDDLLDSHQTLSDITNKLKVRKSTLQRKQRLSKPKNYWLLNLKKEIVHISLRIGLADVYDHTSLSNILGFEVKEREYQFYVNDSLICIFRKMLSGKYKTDWYQQQNMEWDGQSELPNSYVISNGKKAEVYDFIQTTPNLEETSLWTKFSDNEWRLVKGNGTSSKEAAILAPLNCISDITLNHIEINKQHLLWGVFEGEVNLKCNSDNRKYLSQVNSFDWTIISQKPDWMLKSNMPVVRKKPTIVVYDEEGKQVNKSKFNVSFKLNNAFSEWKNMSSVNIIPPGLIKVRIEKDGLVAHDFFYNIEDLKVKYLDKRIEHAEILVENNHLMEFKLIETSLINITNDNQKFLLKVNPEFSKIPISVKGTFGKRNLKKLQFELASPFEDMAIIDKDGNIINEGEKLSLSNIYGLRILSTKNKRTILRITNILKSSVVISKEINVSSQPIIAYRDEITQLHYLADSMNYQNKVKLHLIEGDISKVYEFSGFSHSLDVEDQLNGTVKLFSSDDELDLYAIPLNCKADEIELMPLGKEAQTYTIPSTSITNQFIVISTKEDNKQLMPRFVNIDPNIIGINKEERIEQYHAELYEHPFESNIWQQLLIYFNVCVDNQIPFSTFDQLRAVSISSKVLARAFFFIGINQTDKDLFIQKYIPEMEKDLGVCFHWINKKDWHFALDEIFTLYKYQYYEHFTGLISSYMQELGLSELTKYLSDSPINNESTLNSHIRELRSQLGERVLMELPRYCPKVTQNYGISVKDHYQVKLLIKSPIAVAESITGTFDPERSIWSRNEYTEGIRRNIQYSQYLNPEFYNRTILHSLRKIKEDELQRIL